MPNKVKVFVLDDNIPKPPDMVEARVFETGISGGTLLALVDAGEWKGQHNLRTLTSELVKSSQFQRGIAEVYGFTHPSIALDDIDRGNHPDVIIFDWEYGAEHYNESSNYLTQLLEKTQSFIFVYSQVRDYIPPFLNKSHFDQYADRFQLFLKGETEDAIYSSEEFILQYVLARAEPMVVIKLQGLSVEYLDNGYLKNPSDILHLENILGRAVLLRRLRSVGLRISDETIETLLAESEGVLLFDAGRKVLVAPDSTVLVKQFELTSGHGISYLQVLKRFGLLKLEEALEIGIARV